jgi:regulator of nonsense transcripts 2
LNEYLSELIQRREWKNELRASNTNVENRPEESDLHKLDSSLKKNTAFVRKVKNFSEAQKDSILKEMTTLNLTKYIGEVAAAIVEAKLKMNDLPGIIEISSK